MDQNMASSPSPSLPARQRSEESWVEIESRPSSSFLSSAAEDIVTTGLRVQHDSNAHRRRRRLRSSGQFQIGTGHRIATAAGGSSSQEEYDESESESDRVMTSSSEGIGPSPLQHELRRPSRHPHSAASSETLSEGEGDDDENATAVNYPRNSTRHFEPRPNAFSHPRTQHTIRTQSGTVQTDRRPVARSSHQHSPFDALSPNHQTDHDEALRASLSTLLSAAAAVRGLPKPGQPRPNAGNTSTRVDPTSLRMVPESVALGEASEDADRRDPPGHAAPHGSVSNSPTDKSKRKGGAPISTNVRSHSKDRRAIKKARRASPLLDEISPTLFTWVVSAGVVVLVSALSFSAGYVVGKEAGHADALGQIGNETSSCGKESVSGLRRTGMSLKRLRWSGASGVRV